MADLSNYLVRRGHIFSRRLRAPRGLIVALDPEDVLVRQSVQAGRLIPTEDEATGELQKMPPPRFSRDKKRAKELEADQPLVTIEDHAKALVGLKLDALIAALPAAAPEVIMAAGELEGHKDKPRKGALEAMAAALADG